MSSTLEAERRVILILRRALLREEICVCEFEEYSNEKRK